MGAQGSDEIHFAQDIFMRARRRRGEPEPGSVYGLAVPGIDYRMLWHERSHDGRHLAARGRNGGELLADFHRVGMHLAVHIGAEYQPAAVRGKRQVRLQPVVVASHVHQPGGAQHAGGD